MLDWYAKQISQQGKTRVSLITYTIISSNLMLLIVVSILYFAAAFNSKIKI
jgi:hypothetical protein